MEKFENEITKLNEDPEFRSLMHMEKIYEKEGATIIQNAKNEGKAEEKIEIAKNMLEKSMDVQTISEITKLTKEEIESLK